MQLLTQSTGAGHFSDSGPIHTTPGEFENAALLLRLGLSSTLIRHENGAFRKRSSNRKNLKTPAFRFGVDRKHFLKTELFENDDVTKTR